MGFLKKIFGGGKKKSTKNEDGTGIGAIGNTSFPSASVSASEARSRGRKGKGSTGISTSASISTTGSNALYSNNPNRYNTSKSGSQSIGDLGSPRSSNGPVDMDDEEIIIRETKNVEAYYEQVRNQSQEELRIAYEKSQAQAHKQKKQNLSLSISVDEKSANANANANASGDHDDSTASSPRLTTNHLQQWDRNTSDQQQPHLHQNFSSSPTNNGGKSTSQQPQQPHNSQPQPQPQPQPQKQRVYTMSSALPSQQQINALDDMNHSESDASSFNLSTDAEDSEYETMKRTTGSMYYAPANLSNLAAGLSALDTSAIDTVASINSYTTDEDRTIFLNLATDDDMTLATEASSKTGQPMPPSLLLRPLPNPLQGSQVTVSAPVPDHGLRNNTATMTVETNHTPTAGTSMANHSHTSLNTSNDSSIIKNTNHQNSLDPSWTDFAADPANQPTSTKSTKSNSRNKPGGTPRNFTTPKSMLSTNMNMNLTTNTNSNSKTNLNTNMNTNTNANTNTNTNKNTNTNMNTKTKTKTNTNTNTTMNNDFSSDGFGIIRTSSGTKMTDTKNDSYRNNHRNNIAATAAADDTGFVAFGNFADFSDFPPTAAMDKGGAEWATVKEEKKDQSSWENQNNEFFDNTTSSKNTKPNSSFGNDIDDPAWNISMSSPSAKNNNSGERSRDDPFYAASAVGGSSHVSAGSSSGFQSTQDTSLTELLEAAKSKRKDRRSYGNTRHSNRVSTSSVNSAPAITASYLRQHHNLGSSSNSNRDIAGDDLRYSTGASQGNSYTNNNYNGDRSGADGTSVSDIIHSLDATDRIKRADQIITSHRSMGEVGVVATARAAKERLRERRRRERDSPGSAGRNPNIRHSTSRDQSDSDESEGHKNSESWLFDQVTGAIGPVGIAADLESLSGRSNRSKNSHGGKSHKSSVTGNRRRSSRKTGSSSRRHRSDRSVDSHGSRASRYSHRSTKSFLSQMSEQSRSVANDLLRLEMQLAMVGNNNNNNNNNKDADGIPVVPSSTRMSSGTSLGGGSRVSVRSLGRKSTGGLASARHGASSSVVRRSKTTIVAPPGKLGIILANKADSKGTVVSGVRTSSVLVDRISPGDRIVAIDGEDVSRMTVSEITTIMSRKAEYERRLTVLTASSGRNVTELRSPTNSRSSPRAASVGGGDYGGDTGFSGTKSLSSYRRS